MQVGCTRWEVWCRGLTRELLIWCVAYPSAHSTALTCPPIHIYSHIFTYHCHQSRAVPASPFRCAAPEQLLGHRCTLAADVYSFGLVLVELTTHTVMRRRGQWRLPRAPEECPQASTGCFCGEEGAANRRWCLQAVYGSSHVCLSGAEPADRPAKFCMHTPKAHPLAAPPASLLRLCWS